MEPELPYPWTEHVSADGLRYYHNSVTNESRWDRPEVKRPRLELRLDVKLEDEENPERRRAALDERKTQLLESFTTRDSIFDPKLGEWLSEWMKVSESLAKLNEETISITNIATQAASTIANSHSGFGDDATILGQWLDLVSEPCGEEKLSASNYIGTLKLKEIVLETKGFVHLLDELLVKHENVPKWLVALLETKVWRSLFIELASKNRSSPFLNFCVRWIAEHGAYEEVASTDLTASSYFSVFSRTMADLLASLIKECQETDSIKKIEKFAELEFKIGRIVKLAKSTNYATFYCGQMLADLQNNKSIHQDLSRWVIMNITEKVEGLPIKLMNRAGLIDGYPTLTALVLEVILDKKEIYQVCGEIYALYNQDPTTPIWPLCEYEFLNRLMKALFHPNKKISETERDASCMVLALASFSKPIVDEHSNNNNHNEEGESDSRKSFFEACKKCSLICSDSDTLANLTARWKEIEPLCTNSSTISLGILYWSKALLEYPEFLRSHAFSQGFLTICKIAQFASSKYPLHRPYAFSLLQLALHTRPPEEDGTYYSDTRLAELIESVIDAFVDLMSVGYVMPVLDYFVNSADLDLSLLRRFLIGTLQIVQPPFSKSFLDKFNTLLESPRGLRAGAGGGNEFVVLKTSFLSKVKQQQQQGST